MEKGQCSKKTRYATIEKFRKLSLHPTTIEYLISLGSDLKNYHYYDLLRLDSLDVIQNLSEENQLRLMKSIIENRRKIGINNRNNLMEVLSTQRPCSSTSEFWFETVLKIIGELEKMYILTEQGIKEMDKGKKRDLVTALQLHSIRNLNTIILIKRSFSNTL